MDWLNPIVAFALGFMFNWYFLIFAFCGCLWCDHRESRIWAILWAILVGVVVYNVFAVVWMNFWWILAAYIPVGFLWSIWRWKRYVDGIAKKFADGTLRASQYARESATKDEAQAMLNLTDNLDRTVYWVFMWPVSALEAFVGDFIDIVERTILNIADWTYNKISANAAAKIEATDVERNKR